MGQKIIPIYLELVFIIFIKYVRNLIILKHSSMLIANLSLTNYKITANGPMYLNLKENHFIHTEILESFPRDN